MYRTTSGTQEDKVDWYWESAPDKAPGGDAVPAPVPAPLRKFTRVYVSVRRSARTAACSAGGLDADCKTPHPAGHCMDPQV